MKNPISLQEQETTVNFRREDNYLTIYTSDSTTMTKLRKLMKAEQSEWTLLKETDWSMEVKAPKNLLSFRTKKTTRNMSDEEKQRLAERMREAKK